MAIGSRGLAAANGYGEDEYVIREEARGIMTEQKRISSGFVDEIESEGE